MKKTILKGFHRPIQIIPACFKGFGLVKRGEYVMERTVIFTESCRHDLGDEHQYSWSKLFGFCFGLFGIHKNCYRYGWRYNTETDRIEIARLIYDNGERKMDKLYDFEIGKEYILRLDCYIADDLRVWWYVDGQKIDSWHKTTAPRSLLRFGCGLYFGGQRPSPKTMTVEIKEGEQ